MLDIRNGILFSHKKWNNGICSIMDGLENIMASEISQRKTNTIWYHLYVECKKHNKLMNITKKKERKKEADSEI